MYAQVLRYLRVCVERTWVFVAEGEVGGPQGQGRGKKTLGCLLDCGYAFLELESGICNGNPNLMFQM